LNALEKRVLTQNLRRHVASLSVDIGERHLWNGDFIGIVDDLRSHRPVLAHARAMRRQGIVPTSALVAPRHFGGIDRSDHSTFWKHGFKALMVTDTAFFRNENYLKETDTIDTLNFEVMADVVASLFAALVEL
jgi:hypothetical protein